jgi:hypothetical protein
MLGISVIGWILLAVVYVPLSAGFAWLALRRWRGRSALIAAAAVVIYAPLVAAVIEAVYVEYRWHALCATAKVEIREIVVVEGFFDDGFRSSGWDDIKGGTHGYRFVEWKDKSGRLWRSEGFTETTVHTSPIDKPSARYHWRSPPYPTNYGHLLQRHEQTITDTASGLVIARSTAGYRYPAFVDQLWAQFMGGGPEICGGGSIRQVLVGVDRKEK